MQLRSFWLLQTYDPFCHVQGTRNYTGTGQDWEKKDGISFCLLHAEEDSFNFKIIWKKTVCIWKFSAKKLNWTNEKVSGFSCGWLQCMFISACLSLRIMQRKVYYPLPRMVYHVCLNGCKRAFGEVWSSIYVIGSTAVAKGTFLPTSYRRWGLFFLLKHICT